MDWRRWSLWGIVQGMRQRGYWGVHEPTEYSRRCWGVSGVMGAEQQVGGRQRLYFVVRKHVLYATLADSPEAAACDTWFDDMVAQAHAGAAETEHWTRHVLESLNRMRI